MRQCISSLLGIVLFCAFLSGPVPAGANPIATFDTVLGSFQVELFADAAPITVGNFLNYVSDGDYDGTFVHRVATLDNSPSGTPFAVQGGGYMLVGGNPVHVPTDPPIVNEFSPTRPNVRGTIAMAKTSDPNSATSEWFINTIDNPFLDIPANSGGFAVFGQVLGNGMQVVDAIAALPKVNAGGAFATLPVLHSPPQFPQDLVFVNSITVPEPATIVYSVVLTATLLLWRWRSI